MITPHVHLNGTGRAALELQLETAANALLAAIGALELAAPNARDYYPLGDDAYPKARDEHNARIGKLADVLHELQAIHETVAG